MNQVETKPEELRKGNLMTNNLTGDLIVVKAYDIYCLEEGMDSFIMQPIPLTEEWLKKIDQYSTYGDQKWISLTKLKAELHFEIFTRELHGTEIVTTIKSKFSDLILDPIKYVHQLQNLYFAMTGEELTLK